MGRGNILLGRPPTPVEELNHEKWKSLNQKRAIGRYKIASAALQYRRHGFASGRDLPNGDAGAHDTAGAVPARTGELRKCLAHRTLTPALPRDPQPPRRQEFRTVSNPIRASPRGRHRGRPPPRRRCAILLVHRNVGNQTALPKSPRRRSRFV
jgi:hypothetical protein